MASPSSMSTIGELGSEMASMTKRNKAPAVAFVTMGCAKNDVDTAHMKSQLASAGFELVDDPELADAVVVNTCSFIQSATEESIAAIFDAAGLPNVEGGAPLIVAGCMPSRYGKDLEDELVEAKAFVPCDREDDIASIVADALGIDAATLGGPHEEPGAACALPVTAYSEDSAVCSYVKISDGCDRFCSYCAIPFIRGRYHSCSYEEVSADVASAVSAGAREVDLVAQDTGRWGSDFAEPQTLADLVRGLAEEFPQTWFRLLYIQPEGLTDELLDVVAGHDNVCDYFDIPLQHVDPEILAAMNRKGSREEFEALVAHVLERVPDAALRTTLIAGFPGETDEQFEELCGFVEEGLFDYVGVFPYSREEGTRAYDLPDQIDEEEKADRAQRIRDIADAVSAVKITGRIGKQMDVLVEGREEDGQLFGRAMCQAPDVDGATFVDKGEVGEVRRVTIVDTLMYEMEGE